MRTPGENLSRLRDDMTSVHVFKALAQETCNGIASLPSKGRNEEKATSYITVDFK